MGASETFFATGLTSSALYALLVGQMALRPPQSWFVTVVCAIIGILGPLVLVAVWSRFAIWRVMEHFGCPDYYIFPFSYLVMEIIAVCLLALASISYRRMSAALRDLWVIRIAKAFLPHRRSANPATHASPVNPVNSATPVNPAGPADCHHPQPGHKNRRYHSRPSENRRSIGSSHE